MITKIRHIGSGVNSKKGTVLFNGETSKNISFSNPFSSIPAVDISLLGDSSAIPYRINTTNSGFTIKLKIKYTGTIEWKAIEL